MSFRVRVRFRFGFGIGNVIGGAVGTVGSALARRLYGEYISGNGEVVMKVLEAGKLNTFQRF